MENHTAKHFVLQLGSLITLYLSIGFLLVLLFSIINLLYPDPIEGYYGAEQASQSVRLGIAMLAVFFPAYLILTRKVNQVRRKESSDGSYSGLTKWLIYLSLLVGGGVILGDLVAVILGFLNGELTTRFLLKAGALLLIVGVAFYYYLQDARGYWMEREKMSINYAMGMIVIVVASLILGFSHTETPSQVREIKLDQKQVTDLQEMQYRIEDSLRTNNELPATIEELYVGIAAPTAPENRPAYTYETTDTSFKLCADFAYPSQNSDSRYYPISEPYMIDSKVQLKGGNNWDHKEGNYCFERVIENVDATSGDAKANLPVPTKVIN